MTGRAPVSLPIDAIRAEVEAAVRDHDTLVVVAPTGSGKSTRLPVWLADALEGPVLVVEPRRVACRTLAGFVADTLGCEVGQDVGYRVRFEDLSSARTRVLYATTGMAQRMLAAAVERRDAWPWAAVILDEFHERSAGVDLLATVLRAASGPARDTPLVFTSATLDVDALVEALGDVAVLRAEGRTFPVELAWRPGPDAPTTRDLTERVAEVVREVVEGEEDDGGDVLVFLPGKGEIASVASALDGWARARATDVVPVHASLPPHLLMRAFEPSWPRRRVFLATNVAETSVTLPGVTTVVDSGLVRRRVHRAGRSALAVVPCSLPSLEQRAGRAGRVRPGRCVRLFSARFEPDATDEPELARIELDDFLLEAAVLGLDGAAFDEAAWVDAPPRFAVQRARAQLRHLGALGADNRVTPLGRAAARMPTSPCDALVLVDAPAQLLPTLCDLVALLEREADPFLPIEALDGARRDDVLEARERLLDGIDDEVSARLVVLRRGEPGRHGLHAVRLRETREVAARLRREHGVDVRAERDPASLPDRAQLAAHLIARWPRSAFARRPRADRRGRSRPGREASAEPWANADGDELLVRPWRPPIGARSLVGSPREPARSGFGVLLGRFWSSDRGRRVRGHGRMLLPCTASVIAAAGLGEVEIERVALERRRVVAGVRRTLAGAVVETGEVEPTGEVLCGAVAELVLQNRLFKGAGDAVRDAHHLATLALAWPGLSSREQDWPVTDETGDAAVRDFLTWHLARLGLETNEDLSLLDAADLVPDVGRLTGVASWDLESLAVDFPREWRHQGGLYACRIEPVRELVTLTPGNASARRSGEPDSRFLPRFRGFRVVFEQASRVVRVR